MAKIAIIDTTKAKDNILAIFEPSVQVAPIQPSTGQALIILDSHPSVAALDPVETINGYKWDAKKGQFVKKGLLG